MQLGVVASSQNFLASNINTINSSDVFDEIRRMSSKIPLYASDFKREYLFIRGLNSYFKSFSKKLDLLNHGLFETKLCNDIIKYMKRFLKKQKRGEFNSLDKLFIPGKDIDIISDILFFNDILSNITSQFIHVYCTDFEEDEYDYDDYDEWKTSIIDSTIFHGYKNFYNTFSKINDKLNYNRYYCESESESEIESESE